MDVLRAYLYPRALNSLHRGGNVDRGHAENDLAASFALYERAELVYHRDGLVGRHVHLPVAGYDGFSLSLVHDIILSVDNGQP